MSHVFLLTVTGLLNFIEQVSQASKTRPTSYLDPGTYRRRSNSGKSRRRSTVHGIVKRSCSIQADSPADVTGARNQPACVSVARVHEWKAYSCLIVTKCRHFVCCTFRVLVVGCTFCSVLSVNNLMTESTVFVWHVVFL